MVCHEGKCYIFGGQDDDNNKLNDLWELDLSTSKFQNIPVSDEITGRSGHSANIYNGKMFIFGGILELTKELNEMIAYNFKTQEVEVICENTIVEQAKKDEISAPHGLQKKYTISKGPNESLSPMKRNTIVSDKSPLSPNKSPSKKTSTVASKKMSSKNKEKLKDGGEEEKESGLASPTSVSMQNSFIIKNADETFDAYYQQMRKRKFAAGQAGLDGTINSGGQS